MVQWRKGREQEVYGWVRLRTVGYTVGYTVGNLLVDHDISSLNRNALYMIHTYVLESYGTMVNYYGTMVVGFSIGSLSSTMVDYGH